MKQITLLLAISVISLYSAAQNVGIGTTTPNRAKLEVNGVSGNGSTSGIFGGDGAGISLQKDWPSLGFNQYRDMGTGYGKHIGLGYAANQYLDPNSGSLYIDMLSSGAANSEISTSINALHLSNLGNVGIRGASLNSELQLPNTINNRKITLWESANNPYQYYGFGIRSGEMTYNVGDIGSKHTFQWGASATGSGILMQFGGDMDLSVYTQNIFISKSLSGDQNLLISNRAPDLSSPTTYLSNSVALGRYVFQGGCGDNSVAVGYMAGRRLGGTGNGPFRLNNCTFIGNLTSQVLPSNYSGQSFLNSMALGYGASISESNQVRIGNWDIQSIGGNVGWSTLSDGRLKKDITDHVAGLDFIMRLKPAQYKYNRQALYQLMGATQTDVNEKGVSSIIKDNIVYTGFIAQQVEEAANQAGFNFSGIDKPENPDGLYALRYAEFVVPLVKAVQEQQQIIQQQQQQIDELIKEMKLLQKNLK